MIVGTIAKTPTEDKDFTIDWSLDLASGEILTDSVLDVVNSSGVLTIPNESFSDSAVTLTISGGAAAASYEILNTVTTSHDNILEASLLVRVSYLVVGETCFTTLAEADEYHALAQNSTWLALSASAREGYLIRATRVLNRQRWLGEKTEDDQPLAWPRAGTGVAGVVDDTTPQAIKDACAEMALMIGAETYDVENDANTAQKLQTIKAGSVSLTYFRGAEGAPRRFPTVVSEILRDYLAGAGVSLYGTASGVEGVSSTKDDLGYTEGL